MSSSAARAPSHPPSAVPAREVSPFHYDELPAGLKTQSEERAGPVVPAVEAARTPAAGEVRARQLGREDGRAEARKAFDEQLARERSAIAAALTQFARERGAYYAKVETEVVELALAIARQILHREAQVDPLLLAGIARVALERMEGSTGVALRVHPTVAPDWQRYLSRNMDPEHLPRIVEDAGLEPERCALETSMGTAQLGIELQLKEIEQGFMDLLAARPQENR